MVRESKSTILIAITSAISAVVVAVITTYGTIAVSQPEAKKVKKQLEEISDIQLIANLPVGTIIPSMFQPSLFAETVGDPSVFDPTKSKWVLADGEKDITRSRYGKWLGNTRFTPDLRGMFLRGMNEGRDEGKEDTEKNRAAGDYQRDAIQEHNHEIKATWLGWQQLKENDKGQGYTSGGYATEASVTTVKGDDVSVAKETRPKNVAVYFYIKIN